MWLKSKWQSVEGEGPLVFCFSYFSVFFHMSRMSMSCVVEDTAPDFLPGSQRSCSLPGASQFPPKT